MKKLSDSIIKDKPTKTKASRSKSYKLDLRIHSPASLGYQAVGGLDTAPALVRLAKVKGLDVIGITDANSGAYIDRIIEAAKGTSITVLPGVEIKCAVGGCDDVILTVLFPEAHSSEIVTKFLNIMDIPASAAGSHGHLVTKDLNEIISIVDSLNGTVFPCRMDKTPHRFQAIESLVEVYGFRSFDLAYADSAKYFKRRWPKIKFNFFSFSEAKALAQVGSRTAKMKLSAPGFVGIKEVMGRESQH